MFLGKLDRHLWDHFISADYTNIFIIYIRKEVASVLLVWKCFKHYRLKQPKDEEKCRFFFWFAGDDKPMLSYK